MASGMVARFEAVCVLHLLAISTVFGLGLYETCRVDDSLVGDDSQDESVFIFTATSKRGENGTERYHRFEAGGVTLVDGYVRRSDIIEQQCSAFERNLRYLFGEMDEVADAGIASLIGNTTHMNEISVSINCTSTVTGYSVYLPRRTRSIRCVYGGTFQNTSCNVDGRNDSVRFALLAAAARADGSVRRYAEKHCVRDRKVFLEYLELATFPRSRTPPRTRKLSMATVEDKDGNETLSCIFSRQREKHGLSKVAVCKAFSRQAAKYASVQILDFEGFASVREPTARGKRWGIFGSVWVAVDVSNTMRRELICRCVHRKTGMTAVVPVPLEDYEYEKSLSAGIVWICVTAFGTGCVFTIVVIAACLTRRRRVFYTDYVQLKD